MALAPHGEFRLGAPLPGCQSLRRILKCLLMASRNAALELLAPFGVSLSGDQIDKLLVYVDLLMRWNRKINLTSIRTEEECITRHFGESFLLSKLAPLQGRLLDIGSGAGFPGLAVKLIAPELEVTLLEPVAKKRAFLKEAARACDLKPVHVLGARIEEFCRSEKGPGFDIITARAVGGLESLVPAAEVLLKQGGIICLWVGTQQIKQVKEAAAKIEWFEPVAIPASDERRLLAGKLSRDDSA